MGNFFMGTVFISAKTPVWNASFLLSCIFNHLQAKERLLDCIERFLKERIILPGEAISKTYANTKINNGDVILTYAWYVFKFKVY